MITAHRIFEGFGPGVATTLVVGRPVEVTGLHVYGDPAGPTADGALVLATGALTAETQIQVVVSAAERQAAGVVLRAPVADHVCEWAADIPLALGELADDVSWVQFISMADAMLQQVNAPLDNADDAHQRIFRLSDDVAELLAAPITVEDVRSQVVAYSAFGETADQARMDSILGRAVPDKVVTQLRAAGTFRRLATSLEPFKVEIEDPSFLTRLVVPIRVGPEVIGSIWAIHNGELTPQKRKRLVDMARSLGLLLVRLRAHEELSSRYTADRIREAFRRPADSSSTEPLILPAPEVRVAALGRLNGTSAQNDLALWRTVFRRHAWADPILTDLEGLVFALLTDGNGPGSWSWARSLSLNGRIGQVGASRPTSSAAALPARNREALEVLGTGVALERPAVSYEEVWAQLVIRRNHANLPCDLIHDLSRLDDKGRDRQALAATLLIWLMNWGDYNRAAQVLRLHPNTVRQRMRRIEHLLRSVDLSDPEQRLAVTLVLQAHLHRDEPVRRGPDSTVAG
ncbi:PucR family transcriptional regulator [Streptomyces sp. NPDC004629]|uniref:PucR family transcriptional regulator n=1 Tax=Streptomyces sp. NPDC004629 TaxID=3364705 RepID=UPI00368F6C9A